MVRAKKASLEAPRGRPGVLPRQPQPSSDRFGRFTEWIARAMGTPLFLLMLSLACIAWISWNTLAPMSLRFDSAANGFTALTLMLSLQASYAAPLILLAQNRQDDRERVQIEQDRQRAERNLADTEYLAREIVALRMALTDVTSEVVTKDVLRQELARVLEQLDDRDAARERSAHDTATARTDREDDHRPREEHQDGTDRP
ncbi:DUF1003 domain-containing protein [Microbacterium jiangjiandongii]|uniref:DUF1003 domain-containing protein n=1 Tax=Microbacterium jiangjiandongii TaxID=3049071 RepID=UPI00214CCCE3|nr:DUF1003 domain-containing protein [Microbacterium sp. zg.Y843]MCR2814241.1 DUF1003 domain-containing protein [Microbacterium sp. zg.Y843]